METIRLLAEQHLAGEAEWDMNAVHRILREVDQVSFEYTTLIRHLAKHDLATYELWRRG